MKILRLIVVLLVMTNCSAMRFDFDKPLSDGVTYSIKTNSTGSCEQRGFIYIKTSYAISYKQPKRLIKTFGTIKIDCIEIFWPTQVRRVFIDSFSVHDYELLVAQHMLDFIASLGNIESVWVQPQKCGVLDLQKELKKLGYCIDLSERFYVVDHLAYRR